MWTSTWKHKEKVSFFLLCCYVHSVVCPLCPHWKHHVRSFLCPVYIIETLVWTRLCTTNKPSYIFLSAPHFIKKDDSNYNCGCFFLPFQYQLSGGSRNRTGGTIQWNKGTLRNNGNHYTTFNCIYMYCLTGQLWLQNKSTNRLNQAVF